MGSHPGRRVHYVEVGEERVNSRNKIKKRLEIKEELYMVTNVPKRYAVGHANDETNGHTSDKYCHQKSLCGLRESMNTFQMNIHI